MALEATANLERGREPIGDPNGHDYSLYRYNHGRYNWPMIVSYADKTTERIFNMQPIKRIHPQVLAKAKDKLDMIERATALEDLKVPPGNKLEPLKGDRAGQHSIRVNDQWRICFTWKGREAHGVEFCDYH
jgi:proteic killer suppression protein